MDLQVHEVPMLGVSGAVCSLFKETVSADRVAYQSTGRLRSRHSMRHALILWLEWANSDGSLVALAHDGPSVCVEEQLAVRGLGVRRGDIEGKRIHGCQEEGAVNAVDACERHSLTRSPGLHARTRALIQRESDAPCVWNDMGIEEPGVGSQRQGSQGSTGPDG